MPLTLAAATSTTLSGDPTISAASIAKALASPNQAIRNKTIRNLSTLLPSLSPLPESTLLKIWQGIFYCYWHSDKPLYQSNLATSIAGLVSVTGAELGSLFLDAGLVTLRSKWSSIDFLRMDKFYLLVRRILKHTFLLLKMNEWELDLVERIVRVFETRVFGDGATRGFSLHFVEVFLEELNGFLPVKKEVLEILISPFLNVLEKSNDSVLVNKVKVSIFGKFSVNGAKYLSLKKSGGEIAKGGEVDLFGIIGLVMGFEGKLLELAKKEETVNKEVLHDLRDGFVKLEKDLKKSELEIGIEICEGENVENEKVEKKRKKKDTKKELDEKKEKMNNEKNNKEEKKEKQNKKKKMRTEGENTTKLEENNNTKKGKESSTKKKQETESETLISFTETSLSNLQKQFEIAAKESGLPSISPSKTPSKKKPSKKPKFKTPSKTPSKEQENQEDLTTTSVKKVRFSIKDNIVWKPSSPMPPVSVRIPPSVTPRGSALKKGVPAGPVRTEMEMEVKRRRVKKKKAMSVGKKSPGLVKRRKLQNMSA